MLNFEKERLSHYLHLHSFLEWVDELRNNGDTRPIEELINWYLEKAIELEKIMESIRLETNN